VNDNVAAVRYPSEAQGFLEVPAAKLGDAGCRKGLPAPVGKGADRRAETGQSREEQAPHRVGGAGDQYPLWEKW